jgi:hypothetical protein
MRLERAVDEAAQVDNVRLDVATARRVLKYLSNVPQPREPRLAEGLIESIARFLRGSVDSKNGEQ